jgi:hypothetical protein
MYVATTKDEGNAADGRFSTTREDVAPGPFLLGIKTELISDFVLGEVR